MSASSILNFSLHEQKDLKTHLSLVKDDSASVSISVLPNSLQLYALDKFDEMFAMHPQELGDVIMNEKTMKSSRWHESYLNTPKYSNENKSYMFCGKEEEQMEKIQKDLPKIFQPFLDHLNDLPENKTRPFNQVVANWFKDGSNHIPFHSDYKYGIESDTTPVTSITFSPATKIEECRIFSIKLKKKSTVGTEQINYTKVNIPTTHGLVISMEGTIQDHFWHGIVKGDDKVLPRISLSFRKYYN